MSVFPHKFLVTSSILFAAITALAKAATVTAPSPAEVKAVTTKMADWQIDTIDETLEYRAHPPWRRAQIAAGTRTASSYHPTNWHFGALYVGFSEWSKVADDPAKYTDFLRDYLEPYEWKLYGKKIHGQKYHADSHVVGLTYLSLYEVYEKPEMMEPLRETFDAIIGNPQMTDLEYGGRHSPKPYNHNYRWGWCDALFMSPPVWARLARITGEERYLEFMDREYRFTYDVLWNEEDHLFYRDTRYLERFENNGERIYWSRGNGWVFGGLALMIPDLPDDWSGRSFYVDVFKKMAAALKDLQRSDGTWSMGLMGDEADYPIPETSGTAFITYGLAWGVNQGLLDPDTYKPIIFKAWDALTNAVTEEGYLGYVQPVGFAPGDAFPDKTELYGIGAFLLAGTEVYKIVSNPSQAQPVQ